MSKYVVVPNGNYKLTVQSGGEITLDTGLTVGQVRITGNLLVQGTTTFVESSEVQIRDNIITLNKDDPGPGITLGESGLRLNRGTGGIDAFFVFNESLTWTNPITQTPVSGAFVFKNESGSLVGIRTNSITTGGGDLFLINQGSGVVSIKGTNNYKSSVIAHGDDALTNKKYVDDAIIEAFATVLLTQIGDGEITPTTVRALDQESTGNLSKIEFNIDSTNIANFFIDRFEFDDIRIQGTRIETIPADQDLILASPGTGIVKIEDTLLLESLPTAGDTTVDPAAPLSGTKIYAKEEDLGKTGIYFVNESQNRDELISRNRSLLYSMIF
jgi:hypothetical protein